jgi:glucose/arabinose dehydrogenase
MIRRHLLGATVGLALVLVLLGCSRSTPTTVPTTGPTGTGAGAPTQSPTPTASPMPPTPTAAPPGPATVTVLSTSDVATGLTTPWGLAFLPDARALVTLRNSGRIMLVDRPGHAVQLAGPGADQLARRVRHVGESGLLGIAVSPTFAADHTIYVYLTRSDGNAVMSLQLIDGRLVSLSDVFAGIPSADHHDGGRLAFGPDGYLYVTTGDAGVTSRSQNPNSLGGKILRITASGVPAPGNPTSGSPVWTLGHRNVEGIGWAADGRMFASEFGQNTWDELNLITPGSNYGWPIVEGNGDGGGTYVRPLAWWATDSASPSGLAVTAEGVYLAALKGERLLRVPLRLDGVGIPQALLVGTLGRLRAVVPAPDGSLWLLTNNPDGRGAPRAGDDRIVRLVVG